MFSVGLYTGKQVHSSRPDVERGTNETTPTENRSMDPGRGCGHFSLCHSYGGLPPMSRPLYAFLTTMPIPAQPCCRSCTLIIDNFFRFTLS